MTIKIVTDSACDVPEVIVAELGITTVPVYINIGSKSYLDGVELSRQAFYDQLPGYEHYPTTAAPAVGAFTQTYERLAREGATEILSIHVAASLSAVSNAARLGAEAQQLIPVTLFDSQQITMGAGGLIILAAEMAAAGRSMADITAALHERTKRTYVFGVLDGLDALRRSGRVNWSTFGVGTLLQIKPVMMIHQGAISVAAKIRTRTRAIEHILKMMAELGPFERLDVIHIQAPQMAEHLLARASHLFPQGQTPVLMNITPAIGIHLGVGAVGFACITKKKG